MPTSSAACVLGAHVVARTVYLGLVRCPDTFLTGDQARRIELAQALDEAAALKDLKDRFREELRRLRPAALAVVHPKMYGGWEYRKAFTRVSLETALMIAAVEEGVRYESVKQGRIAKAVGIPLPTFAKAALTKLGIEPPLYWKDRALAFGAAWAIRQGACE